MSRACFIICIAVFIHAIVVQESVNGAATGTVAIPGAADAHEHDTVAHKFFNVSNIGDQMTCILCVKQLVIIVASRRDVPTKYNTPET